MNYRDIYLRYVSISFTDRVPPQELGFQSRMITGFSIGKNVGVCKTPLTPTARAPEKCRKTA
ncbi:hypothetical protein GF312_21815 [Candidatus Poribacteria bacterium]|nr:hypothetical protein [Candidatus Poribacteria bacterium]